MERLDFASVMAALRRNISEDRCPNQVELVYTLFRDFCTEQPDMEFDNGQICRWINGLACALFPHNSACSANTDLGRNTQRSIDMKATGIVRRVDDLGRIVIPKEIRRTLRIREGDPLEIYTEKDGGVIFRKYSPMGDLQGMAGQICESIGRSTGRIAAVADRDSIIALYGINRRELVDQPNSQELEKLMEQRKIYRYQSGEVPIPASGTNDRYHLGVAAPVLSQGDLMGCIMLLLPEDHTPPAEADQRLVQTMASFLGTHLES